MENKTQKATIVGGIIASVIASACCVGPIAFAMLGISSAGLLTLMAPYRPFISIIALVFLGAAYYFTYKKKTQEDCDTDTYCANPKANIWNKRFLWTATAVILGLLTFPYWSILLI